MIRESNHNQLAVAEFDWPFLEPLDENNRWVKLADIIPWEALSEPYLKNFPNTVQGRPAVTGHLRAWQLSLDLSLLMTNGAHGSWVRAPFNMMRKHQNVL